jgi:hypothetical protein
VDKRTGVLYESKEAALAAGVPAKSILLLYVWVDSRLGIGVKEYDTREEAVAAGVPEQFVVRYERPEVRRGIERYNLRCRIERAQYNPGKKALKKLRRKLRRL